MATLLGSARQDAADEVQPAWTRLFLGRETGRDVRRDIEGMRAIAVLLVLLFHAGVPVPGGLVGVDVFFVISGFIITGSLVKELRTKNKINIVGFYARRAKRLLPATAAVMVVTAALTLAFLPKTRWVSTGWDILASSLYVENWRLQHTAVDYLAQNQAPSPLQHFWSLAVEEQFYIIWPAVLLFVTWWPRRHRPHGSDRGFSKWLLVGMAVIVGPSLAASVIYTASNPASAYFVTYTRLWELGIGGGLAIAAHWLLRTPKLLAALLGWVGLAVVVWSAFVINTRTPFPGTWALAPTLGTAAVLAFGVAAGRLGPGLLLGLAPMVWVGGMSYSLYLWHWPLLVAAEGALGHRLTMSQGLLVVLASAVVAWLSLRLLENPMRHRSIYTTQPQRALSMGMFATLIGVFVGIMMLFSTWPPSPPLTAPDVVQGGDAGTDPTAPKYGAQVLAADPKGDPAGAPKDTSPAIYPDPLQAKTDVAGCSTLIDQADPAPCSYGDETSKVTIALVGDSHAAQWAPALDAAGKRAKWHIVEYTKQACPLADVAVVREGGSDVDKTCTEWNTKVMKALLLKRPQVVILGSEDRFVQVNGKNATETASRAALAAGLVRDIEQLKAKGTQVMVLKDTPRPGMDVPDCVSKNTDHLIKCSFPRTNPSRGFAALDAAAKARAKVIDLGYAICPTDRCAAVIGQYLVYADDNHMTGTYTRTLSIRLQQRIQSYRHSP